MHDILVLELPERPDRNQADTNWWLVNDGVVLRSGVGAEWTTMLAGPDGHKHVLVALAPASAVRVGLAQAAPDTAPPQAEAIARLQALEASLADPQTLHAASAAGDGGQPMLTAVAANGAMLAWLDWLSAFGGDADHVIPVAALLPPGPGWVEARFGSQLVVGRGDIRMPAEPALSAAIVADAEISRLGEEEATAILVAAAMSPPIDLRVGRFARRRGRSWDRVRLRRLALLAASIPLIALMWVLVVLIKLDGETDRLDDETTSLAQAALGRPVPLESAEAELRARSGGSGPGGFQPSLGALYSGLQSDQGVTATELGYRSDGTVSGTLAAPTIDSINRLLVAVQRNGYRITAVPRQSADGRAMADITIRSDP